MRTSGRAPDAPHASPERDILAELSRTVLQASPPCSTTAEAPGRPRTSLFERPNRIPETGGHDFRAGLADPASIRRELLFAGWMKGMGI